MTNLSIPPVFIGGTGRSGTTVIGHVLSCHPDVLLFMESKFLGNDSGIFNFLIGRVTKKQLYNAMTGLYREFLVKSLLTSISISSEPYNANEIFSVDVMNEIFFKSFSPNRSRLEAVTAFVDNIYYHAMVVFKKTRCVEKSPETCVIADALYDMFPGMKIIHAIRDPKDVCCSMIQASWGPNSVTEFIQYYQNFMKAALRSLKAIPQNQLMTVELEKLIYKPQETLEILFDFLDLPYLSHELSKFTNIIKSPEKSNINRYTKELLSEDAQRIDTHCMEMYQALRSLSNSNTY